MKSVCNRWVSSLGLIFVFMAGCQQEKHAPSVPAKSAEPAAVKPAVTEPAAAPGMGSPHLTVDRNTYDFGKVEPGATLDGKFVLTNDGGAPLVVKDVSVSCGCTIPDKKNFTIAPGESKDLNFTYSVGRHPGKAVKSVWIIMEEPTRPPRVELKIAAEVVRYVTHTPEEYIIELREPHAPLAPIVLESLDQMPFKIESAGSTGDALRLNYDASVSAVRHEIQVDPNYVTLAKTPGGAISITVDHTKVQTLTIPFKTMAPFTANPTTKFFRQLVPGGTAEGKVSIVSNFKEPFELGAIHSEKGLVSMDHVEKLPDGSYDVYVTLKVPADQKVVLRDTLFVEIKDRPDHTIMVLFYGRMKE